MSKTASSLRARTAAILDRIYPDQDTHALAGKVIEAFWPDDASPARKLPRNLLVAQQEYQPVT